MGALARQITASARSKSDAVAPSSKKNISMKNKSDSKAESIEDPGVVRGDSKESVDIDAASS